MTKQETFDIVARHLITQGKRSDNGRGEDDEEWMCQYRGTYGRKCAAGVLIPDDRYDPCMEGDIVADASTACRVIHDLGHDTGLVRQLQIVHDSSAPNMWRRELRAIAASNGLSDRVVAETEAL